MADMNTTTQRTRHINKLLAERVSSLHTLASLRASQLADGYVPTIHDREVAQLLVNEGIRVYFAKGLTAAECNSMAAELTLDGVIFQAIREDGGLFSARDIVAKLDDEFGGCSGIAYSLPATADAEYWATAGRIASRSACRFDCHDLAMCREHLIITERLKSFVRAGLVQRWTTRRVEIDNHVTAAQVARGRRPGDTTETTTVETVYGS
tara:strand:- start:334 stop:960 length:627 start_codon:yes stop_codon:yes gene_type:complete